MEENLILNIKNLHVSFKRKKSPLHIVRGVDIKLPKGKIIGLIGESGSGKSVTTKALLDVNDGAITTFDSLTIGDKTWEHHKDVGFRKNINGKIISYIPQNPMTSLNPSRTIRKHMFDVLEFSKQVDKSEFENKAVEILRTFNILDTDRILSSYPHELSGGLKQRIIISMAILSGSQIMIADEPTTALDVTVQSSVLNLLQEVNEKFGISVIFISHDIAVIAKLCDYIYVMYAGRVVERGTKFEILTDPRHPYTWALISSINEGKVRTGDSKLYSIPGTPPDMSDLPPGDPFAPRNKYAMAIDYKVEPKLFEITPTHLAATWLLHPSAPKVELSPEVVQRIELFKKTLKE